MSGKGLDSLISEQHRLAGRLVLRDGFGRIDTVGGADQAFCGDRIISAIVVCSSKTLEPLEKVHSVSRVAFPYIPTFLSFREAPSILDAWKKLSTKPDVLLVDGQGIAHPRGIGLASHVGALLDAPTIGVAKSWLFGEFSRPRYAGEAAKLTSHGRHIGWVLRSRAGCNPIFISPGNKVSIKSSLGIVSRCLAGHKLPEPARLAHLHAGSMKESIVRNDEGS
jgi:deoxyribonuclease V